MVKTCAHCNREFKTPVAHTLFCPRKPCQAARKERKRLMNIQYTRDYWSRHHAPRTLHPCRGGCGTLVSRQWCDSPECRAKQRASYNNQRTPEQIKASNSRRYPKSKARKVNTGRKCVNCGEPIVWRWDQHGRQIGKHLWRYCYQCEGAWSILSESVAPEFWGAVQTEIVEVCRMFPGTHKGEFKHGDHNTGKAHSQEETALL